MSPEITRRTVARGAAWSVPAVVIAAPAPALAASPCATIVRGKPLPASAFDVTYMRDTNETLGGSLASKQVAIDFGFLVNKAAQACGVTGSITSSNAGLTSRVRLSNGQVYDMTNGGSVPANGTVGTPDTTCQSALNGTQACGTSGQSAYNVVGSANTNGFYVTAISLVRQVTVTGYGTSTIYLNGSGFGSTPGDKDWATTATVSAAPAF